MRARATVGGVIASAAVLIVGWQVGQSVATSSTGISSASGTTSSGTGSAKNGTFVGDVEQTRFGPMQVQITVAGGAITDVTVLQATDREGRSAEISARADPILTSEVLAAQSANVQMVSGATYTSQGYLQSLQSALDKAGA